MNHHKTDALSHTPGMEKLGSINTKTLHPVLSTGQYVVPPELGNFLGELDDVGGDGIKTFEKRDYKYGNDFVVHLGSTSTGTVSVKFSALDKSIKLLTRKEIAEGHFDGKEIKPGDDPILVGGHDSHSFYGGETTFYDFPLEPLGISKSESGESFGYIVAVPDGENSKYLFVSVSMNQLAAGQYVGGNRLRVAQDINVNARMVDVKVHEIPVENLKKFLGEAIDSQTESRLQANNAIEKADWRDGRITVEELIDLLYVTGQSYWSNYVRPVDDRNLRLRAVKSTFGEENDEKLRPGYDDEGFTSFRINLNTITLNDSITSLLSLLNNYLSNLEFDQNIQALMRIAEQRGNPIPEIKNDFGNDEVLQKVIEGMQQGQYIFRTGFDHFFFVHPENPAVIIHINPRDTVGRGIEFLDVSVVLVDQQRLQDVLHKKQEQEERTRKQELFSKMGLKKVSSEVTIDALIELVSKDKKENLMVNGEEDVENVPLPSLITAGDKNYALVQWHEENWIIDYPTQEIIAGLRVVEPGLAEVLNSFVETHDQILKLATKLVQQNKMIESLVKQVSGIENVVDLEVGENLTQTVLEITQREQALIKADKERRKAERIRNSLKAVMDLDTLSHIFVMENRSQHSDAVYTVGRQPDAVDFMLSRQEISRRHAEITVSSGGSLSIRDLQSKFGTFVNNKDISGKGPVQLNEGDVVRFVNDSYVVMGGMLVERERANLINSKIVVAGGDNRDGYLVRERVEELLPIYKESKKDKEAIEDLRNKLESVSSMLSQARDLVKGWSWRNNGLAIRGKLKSILKMGK